MKTILGIGAGYVGGPTMAMIAHKCPEHRILVVDINEARIQAWESEQLPIYEPGLEDIVHETLNKNLFFSTDIAAGIREADIIFVCVNTPTKMFGRGAGRASDLQYLEKTAREILAHSTSNKIVVEKSTLPVKTAAAMARILQSGHSGVQFEVVSNPEFLAEGTAIADLQSPDRVLIGGRNNESGRHAVEQVAELYAHWVPRKRILTTSVWSSELSKLVANAFLAQRISSINSLTPLCEATGADIEEVSRAVGMDSRIGAKFLKASVGFGGSCFKKDILNLVYLCEYYGLHEAAEYWSKVVQMNEYQEDRFVERMFHRMFHTLAGKRIAVLGFAFKANTGDTRESPAIRICNRLAEECAHIVVSDPKALDNARYDLEHLGDRVCFEHDPYQAVQDAHAVAIMTEWDEYKALNYQRVFAVMNKPAFIFDGRNILDHEALYAIGFNVYPTGKPELTHL